MMPQLELSDFSDPDLHLFLADDEIDSMVGVTRLINQMRREQPQPVLAPDRPWEDTNIAQARVIKDPDDGLYKCWYLGGIGSRPWPLDRCVCYATSTDGMTWDKPALDVAPLADGTPTNVVRFEPPITTGFGGLGLWPFLNVTDTPFDDRFIATVHKSGDTGHGIFRATSRDGVCWHVSDAPIIGAGDSSTLTWDSVRKSWMLMSRIHSAPGVLRQRRIDLWESPDFSDWTNRGRVLAPDERDRPNTELYTLLPIRYGRGFIGFLEVYYRAVERLDTQISWSPDGVHWQRVGHRDPVLPRGGDGDWDSHMVCVTNNAPEPVGDRLRFWYIGGCTPHGSGGKHRRALGLASIRRDGFVCIVGRMELGYLLTSALDARLPHRLTVNMDASAGDASIEVWPGQEATSPADEFGRASAGRGPIEGFSGEDCRLSNSDGVAVEVTWRGGAAVPAQPGGRVHLKFNLRNASLHSYRWSPVE